MRNFKIENAKGWTEVNLDDNCNFDVFNTVAEIIEKTFNVSFSRKIDDFDSYYWDFQLMDSFFTLHYNIYNGVSIFPSRFKDATTEENDLVIQLAKQVFDKL